MREFPFSSHKEFQRSRSFKVTNLGVVYKGDKWYSSIAPAIAYTTSIFYHAIYLLLCTDIRNNVENRHCFDKAVKWRHLITDQDTANIKQKAIDQTIMRHEDDATSVKAIVNELREEPFDPVLFY